MMDSSSPFEKLKMVVVPAVDYFSNPDNCHDYAKAIEFSEEFHREYKRLKRDMFGYLKLQEWRSLHSTQHAE
jgi:hypothetical protein